jgi:hypothetical protein
MAVRLPALRAGHALHLETICFSFPDTHSCQRLSRPQGYSDSGYISKIEKKKIHYLIGYRTREFTVCSGVPEPTRLPRDPAKRYIR